MLDIFVKVKKMLNPEQIGFWKNKYAFDRVKNQNETVVDFLVRQEVLSTFLETFVVYFIEQFCQLQMSGVCGLT